MRKARDSLFLLRILFVAALVPVLVRLSPARLQRILEPRNRRRPLSADEARTIVDRVDWMLSVGRPLVRRGCLTRGITRFWFLRRAGVDVRLVFGLGREDGGAFGGHCWLVLDGEPFFEGIDPRPLYAELYAIPDVSASVT